MAATTEELREERDQLEGVLTKIPVKRARTQKTLDKFTLPSVESQQLAKNTIDAANAVKQSIVTLGGNTGLSTSLYGSSTSNVTSKYGSMVTGVTTALGESLGIAGIGSTAVVAYGTIKNDVIKGYDYPKISGGDYSDDATVFDGEGFYTVTNSNIGIGRSTRFFQNGGSDIGVVFDVNVDVTSLISQYNAGISTVTNQCLVATENQELKMEAQFELWGLERQQVTTQQKLTEVKASLVVVEDPGYGGPW